MLYGLLNRIRPLSITGRCMSNGFFPSTYTVQDVLTEIKRTFGDEAGVQITDADIYRWIDRGQIELFSSLEVKKQYRILT